MKALRDYQQPAFKGLIKSIEAGNLRTSVYAATGAGKTEIFIQLVNYMFNTRSAQKILVIHPRLALSTDQQIRFKDVFDVPFTSFSSGTVEQSTTRNSTVNTQNESTTSKTVLKQILKKHNDNHHIVFSSYDSAHKIADMKEWDLIIADEAHYLTNNKFADLIDSFVAQTAFFTATPIIADSEFSMDNVDKFGEVVGSITPAELIEKGFLVQPRMFYANIKTDGKGDIENPVQSIARVYKEQAKLIKGMPHKMIVAMADTMQFENIMGQIRTLREIIGEDIDLYYVKSGECVKNGSMRASRAKMVDEFKKSSSPSIIIHCDTLAEGIDISGLTGAYIMRNLSHAKFIQTIGRVVRPYSEDLDENYMPIAYKKRIKKFGLIHIAVVDGHSRMDSDAARWFEALTAAGYPEVQGMLSANANTAMQETLNNIIDKKQAAILDIEFQEEINKEAETAGW